MSAPVPHRIDPRTAPVRRDMARLGMMLVMASLGMLFAAAIVGYLVVRVNAPAAPGVEFPLPAGLWASTALLLGCSGSMAWALRRIRHDDRRGLRRGLATTMALALAFLFSQGVSWAALLEARLTATTNLFGFSFFLLTGLHAAHVIGGLVPLGTIMARAFRDRYSIFEHRGVEYTAMYWHFLDGTWIVVFAVLLVAR
jgi:cytochrome c oxidase subunit III